MKHIPRINIEEHYGKELLGYQDIDRAIYNIHDITSLLDSFPKIKNPSFFRHRMMQLTQLYFDGILENPPSDRKKRKHAKNTAHNLLAIGKDVVASFYRGDKMDFDMFCNRIFTHEQGLREYSLNQHPNIRHLERRLDLIQRVGLSAQKNTFPKEIDSLAVTANGGFEPGLLLADILCCDYILPIRFSDYNRGSDPDKRAKCSNLFTSKNVRDNIQSKDILVVEDLVCSGESLMRVMKYVQKRNPSSLVGISAKTSDYYLKNYPPQAIYVKDAETHQFTLDSTKGLNRLSYKDIELLHG